LIEEEPIYVRSTSEGALQQGEILSNLIQWDLSLEKRGENGEALEIDKKNHPWAIVLTQSCDLVSDFLSRQGEASDNKKIPNILFCEVVTSDHLKRTVPPGSDIWKRIKQNKDERYQFLQKVSPENDALNEGVPELGVDFKRYFTIPTDEVWIQLGKGAQRRSQLNGSYLHHLIHRFFFFQLRVALPVDHISEP